MANIKYMPNFVDVKTNEMEKRMSKTYSNNGVYSIYSENVCFHTSNPSISVLRKHFELIEHNFK